MNWDRIKPGMWVSQRIRRYRQQRRFTRHFVELAEDLAILMNSGIPIREGLNYLAAQKKNVGPRRVLLESAVTGVASGASLEKIWTPWLTPLAIATLELGTHSGQLATVLNTWSEQFRRQQAWVRQILKNAVYPLLLFMGNLSVELIVAYVIIPEFKRMYASTGVQLTRQSQFLMNLVQFLPNLQIALILTLLLVAALLALSGRKHSELWHRLHARLPTYPIFIAFQTQRICFLLTIFLRGGAAIIDALRILEGTGASPWLTQRCSEVRVKLLAGERLSQAFAEGFDPLLISTLTVAEQTGDFLASLDQTDRFLKRYTAHRVEFLLKWLEPVMLMVLGLLIALTMYVLFVPMYDMISAISSQS